MQRNAQIIYIIQTFVFNYQVTLNVFSFQTNVDLIDKDKAEKNQQFFTHLLHRYLCSTIGKQNAMKLLPMYIQMLSELEEMAQIMISKRLLY